MPNFFDPSVRPLPPGISPEHPVLAFVAGVIDIFMNAEESGAAADPRQLKAQVDRLLASHPAPPRVLGVRVERQAQELVDRAWDSDEGDVLALDALRLWPNCCEAYLLLALETGEEVELTVILYTLAAIAGAEAIGPEKMHEYTGSFSEHEDALPFLQALAGLSRAHMAAGEPEAAMLHLGEVLRLDSADALGARYELLTLLIASGDLANAQVLIDAYEEPSVPMLYGLALIAFHESGDGPAASSRLQMAKTVNPYIVPYLTGEKPIPGPGPLDFELGTEDEALAFAPLVLTTWKVTPGAIEWLQKEVGYVSGVRAKPPEKPKRSGPREI